MITPSTRRSLRWLGPAPEPARMIVVPKIDRALLELTEYQGRDVYAARQQIQQAQHLRMPRWLPWLIETGRMISPDVIIGPVDSPNPVRGWYGPRVLEWLAAIGRIDEHDEVVPMRQGRNVSYPDPSRWEVETTRYRSSGEIAEAIGVPVTSIPVMLRRGALPSGQIYVGDPRVRGAATQGWDEDTYHNIRSTHRHDRE